jgi:uncharacterized protein
MGRIVFFLLLGIGLYVAFRLWTAKRGRDRTSTSRPPARSEPMVRCDHCGLNLPQSDALADGGGWFCSEAHRRLGRDER